MRLCLAVAVLSLLPGCADLPPIPAGACGNGVVDVGEDCDTFADPGATCGAPGTPSQCAFVCSTASSPDAGAMTCPAGFGCGADGICRHGTGSFTIASGSPWRVQGTRIELGNVDGDAYPDLITLGSAGVQVLYGGKGGSFTGVGNVTFPLLGYASVADVDQDGIADVLAPSISGMLAFRGTPGRSFGAIPFSPFDASTAVLGIVGVPLHVNVGVAEAILVLEDSIMCFSENCLPAGPAAASIPLPNGHSVDQIVGRIPAGDLTTNGNADEIALIFAGDPTAYIYSVQTSLADGGYLYMAPQANIALPGVPAGVGAQLVDEDGDGNLDLMVLVTQGGADHVAVAKGTGTGSLGAAAIEPVFDSFDNNCGTTRWPLAIGQLDQNAPLDGSLPDAVGDLAICVRVGGLWLPKASPQGGQPYAEAVIADFNNDGNMDVAASVDGLDGVDFFLGDGNDHFNPAHVDTLDPVSGLRSGDFNGDFVPDLAIIEHADLSGDVGQYVSVLYGQIGAPAPPMRMARLGFVEGLEPLDLGALGATTDRETDLMVLSREAKRGRGALGGHAARQRLEADVVTVLPAQRHAGAGDHLGVPGAARRQREHRHDSGSRAGLRTELADARAAHGPPLARRRWWRVSGAGRAHLSVRADGAVSPPCAALAVGDLDGKGVDTVVLVDGADDWLGPPCTNDPSYQDAPRLLTVRAKSTTDLSEPVVPLPGNYRKPVQISLADLDGDGHPDLLVTFLGDAGTGGGVVVYWNVGGMIDLGAPTALPVSAPLGATAIDVDGDGQPEIAVLVADGILVFHLAAHLADAGQVVASLPPTVFTPGETRLLAGDLDADGAPDLIAQRGPEATVLLATPEHP